MIFYTFSLITWTLLIVLCVAIALYLLSVKSSGAVVREKITADDLLEPDGPYALPIIGSLHLLSGYRVPYEAFRHLARIYGDVFKIKLGSTRCVVVNGLDNIREVLMAKGDHFDGRPNFERYNLIFNGDKRNSLAFCDWSDLQKTRRELLRVHTFPKMRSLKFVQLNGHIDVEMQILSLRISALENEPVAFKPLLSAACANIFLQHFCGKHYAYEDPSFGQMVYYFDKIFYEVNQGYAADFMPWMLPFYRRRLNEYSKWTERIREFTEPIVAERSAKWTPTDRKDDEDYIDTLIGIIKREEDEEIDLKIAMFSLEDIIGGHSAVANFLMKVFAYIATKPEVQANIKREISSVTKDRRDVSLDDRRSMPYTEAVILETIRLIASPIVPHVASQNSSIAGYEVPKGTMIFLNNYDLNRDPKLWTAPEEFNPNRFLINGNLVKPDHFFPFSSGRRSCMGYKIVHLLSFRIVAYLVENYFILPVQGHSYEVPIGNLALPFDTFEFEFVPRANNRAMTIRL